MGNEREPERPVSELTDEERRLLEHLGLGSGRGEASERGMQAEEARPRAARERASRSYERRVRRLVIVTGAVVAVLVLAELTGTLVGNAWLLALLAVITAIAFYVGFLQTDEVLVPGDPKEIGAAREIAATVFSWHRAKSQVGFFAMLLLFGIAAYFGWREHRTMDELAAIIAPVPEVTGTIYIPTRSEIRGMEALIGGLDVIGGGRDAAAGSLPAPTDRRSAAAAGSEARYWSLTTKLDTAAAMAFYADARNLGDWIVVAEGPGIRQLHREGERLIVVARDDWPRPRYIVSYIYQRE